MFDEPNEQTKATIVEATSGKNPNKSYNSVDEMYNDILNDEEWKSYSQQHKGAEGLAPLRPLLARGARARMLPVLDSL